MSNVNRDPVLGIRKAVASGMVSIGMQPSKELIDAVVDCLPDFFKQPLMSLEPGTTSVLLDTSDLSRAVKIQGPEINRHSHGTTTARFEK